jgi:branched-chain amino acid transport system substrate-binding protein
MKRTVLLAAVVAVVTTGVACTKQDRPLLVGAVYPLSGSQGPGGVDEYRGVRLAVDMVDREGGVHGRPVELRSVDTPDADAAAAAVDSLAEGGARFVLGSYGSTISLPAAREAARRGLLFWETGAVGDMTGSELGKLVFRVAPTGATLGRSAVAFVANQLAPMLHRSPSSLRFAVANVDDLYGRAVARGAVDQIHALRLPLAGQFPYDPLRPDLSATVRRIAASKPDVLFVSAYLQDGVALRRETVRQHLRLLASIGTSSSYCMPQFGIALGRDAVGLFASDKPDAGAINTQGLSPAARTLLATAQREYRRRYGQEMSAAALAGFSGAWALLRSVMPKASALTPASVASAVLRVRLPEGSLPNGSGLDMGSPGTPDAGANMEAASVIWEWVAVGRREVVWPPAFATTGIKALHIAW